MGLSLTSQNTVLINMTPPCFTAYCFALHNFADFASRTLFGLTGDEIRFVSSLEACH